MKKTLISFVALGLLSPIAAFADVKPAPTSDCATSLIYGQPTVPGNIQQVCHSNYVSFYDTDLKIPRLVEYHLTAEHSFGCLPRKSSFHGETQLAPEVRAMEHDYLNSGWDLGHMGSDQDMAWDKEALYDSYSTANVTPQKPGMNRQGWERGEEDVRAWAMERGEVVIYVGDILDPHPDHIGNGVAIPRTFFKVVVDPKTGEYIGYEMNNVDTPKQDLTKFITPIAKIEQDSGITIPLPPGADKTKNVALWHTATSDWRKKHHDLCKSKPSITTMPGGNSAPALDNTQPMPLPHWNPGDPPKVREDLKQSK